MSKRTTADKLLKGLLSQKEITRRDYAVKEINKLSKADLLDFKYQYEASTTTELPWTWMIALYGVLFTLLLQAISPDALTLVPVALFVAAITGACFLTIRLYKVLSGQRYLLGYINNRLEELDPKNNKKRK